MVSLNRRHIAFLVAALALTALTAYVNPPVRLFGRLRLLLRLSVSAPRARASEPGHRLISPHPTRGSTGGSDQLRSRRLLGGWWAGDEGDEAGTRVAVAGVMRSHRLRPEQESRGQKVHEEAQEGAKKRRREESGTRAVEKLTSAWRRPRAIHASTPARRLLAGTSSGCDRTRSHMPSECPSAAEVRRPTWQLGLGHGVCTCQTLWTLCWE